MSFQLLNTIPFITTDGKSVRAEKGSIIRVAKTGRVILVKTMKRHGGQIITSTKERPTLTMLEDIKGLIHTPTE